MRPSKRERILVEAERLFGQHGFAATRLANIASAAGLGNAGLLHHFPSKAALYRVVLEEIASDLGTRYRVGEGEIDAVAKLNELIEGLLSLHRERPSAIAIIAHEFLDQSGRIDGAGFLPLSGFVKDTVAILQAGQRAGTVRVGEPVAMSAALHGVLIIGGLGRAVYRRTSGASETDDWEAELARSAIATVLATR